MDWFWLSVSVFTGFLGGQPLHKMSDKLKDNQNNEIQSSTDKNKTKSANNPSKTTEDNQKVANNSSKSSKDKKKGSNDSSVAKKGDPKGSDEKPMDDNSATARLKTTPYDPRFPNQNQTRNCYQNYLDYHRCLKVKNSESYCHYYKWAYQELCPKAWFEKWDDQRERGIFPGRI